MVYSCNQVLTAIREVCDSITIEAASRMDGWKNDIEQPSFTASAVNLAHYLAFRHHDLRELQRELMRHGLSSLGRLESRVMVTLKTVESVLDALMSGKSDIRDWPPSGDQFFDGEATLQANARTLLGGADEPSGRIFGDIVDQGRAGPWICA
jgi:pyruvate kinase